jgi:8-oxo-dGTP diphosphatase
VREVVGVAVLHGGRVLSARRAAPPHLAGGWELPGGKVEDGESREDAAVREVREELGCTVEVVGGLPGEVEVATELVLVVAVARLTSGDPVPHEHDAVRWLGPDELDDVAWLEGDRPFLPALRERMTT